MSSAYDHYTSTPAHDLKLAEDALDAVREPDYPSEHEHAAIAYAQARIALAKAKMMGAQRR